MFKMRETSSVEDICIQLHVRHVQDKACWFFQKSVQFFSDKWFLCYPKLAGSMLNMESFPVIWSRIPVPNSLLLVKWVGIFNHAISICCSIREGKFRIKSLYHTQFLHSSGLGPNGAELYNHLRLQYSQVLLESSNLSLVNMRMA